MVNNMEDPKGSHCLSPKREGIGIASLFYWENLLGGKKKHRASKKV